MNSSADLMTQADIQAAIYEHARAWFPKECCGLLVSGSAGGRAVLAENLQDRYHALDPETYPRTAEKAYLLDPRLVAKVEAEGDTLAAIVHSHCRVGAYFSDKDQEDARSPFDDGPLYPGVDYVVVDAQEDGVAGHKVFTWSDTEGRFIER
jgi:proteasome lid subunit RPN8/RPN11